MTTPSSKFSQTGQGKQIKYSPFPLAPPIPHSLEFLTDARFRDPDRIFDAIIYTSRSDKIMRYSDEVRAAIAFPQPRFLFLYSSCALTRTTRCLTGRNRRIV